MAFTGFVDDGYTAKGYVEAWPGLHPAVRFEYRPLIQEEISAYEDDCEFKKDADRAKVASKLIADRITKWDLAKPPTPENFRKLVPKLYQRIMTVVMGGRASDIDPNWTEAERADYGEAGLKREDTNEGN